jgi:hypothetical protein
MGCWDVFCVICGNNCQGIIDEDDYEFPREFQLMTKWLHKCTFLTLNNEIVHGCRETSCNISFTDGKRRFDHLTIYENMDNAKLYSINTLSEWCDNYGVFIHTDCWKFVKKHLNIELKYGDLFIDKSHTSRINYGKIDTYWGQEFNFRKVCEDNNEYLCESPLKNKHNAKRIKKIISSLKLRVGRKSPSISATFFKKGTIKIGNDGNFWIVDKNKWIKMSGEIKKTTIIINRKNKKHVNFLKTTSQIGELSTIPCFVQSFGKNYKKNEFELTIIMLEKN